MSEEWGPWIEHDGKGCPCVGQVVHLVLEDRFGCQAEFTGTPRSRTLRSWDWSYFPTFRRVIRYRIRKPRGLTILEGLLENLPEEVDA